jgi:hypothetical protein
MTTTNNNLETFCDKLNNLNYPELFKQDIIYFAQFLKPLPEYVEKKYNDEVCLIWSSEKGLVRYVMYEQTSDILYWLDIKNKQDYLIYDPVVGKINDVLEWLYNE